MIRLTSLLWKEWRTAQAYLWIGLGLFLGMPLIGGLQFSVWYGHRFQLYTSPWVLALGGVLAVLAAVGVTTPDLRPKVADFWQSRPIGVGPWLAAKYAVALAAVLVACTVPLAAEMAFDFRGESADPIYLAFLPFFWTAVFSLAFVAACLIDRPAHAAVLGLAALLAAYVLPVVVPPLAWLNVAELDDRWLNRGWPHAAAFAGGMSAVSAAAVALAFVGVRRGWRVESGRKLLYGLVATALLLLFASAAFQLGTNLPVIGRADVPATEQVRAVELDGDHGSVLIQRQGKPLPGSVVGQYEWTSVRRSLDLTPSGPVLGPPEAINDDLAAGLSGLAWSATSRGRFIYNLDWENVPGHDDLHDVRLIAVDRRQERPTRTLPLWQHQDRMSVGPRVKEKSNPTGVFLWADRLYAFDDGRLAVFDVAAPGDPRQLSSGPFDSPDYPRWGTTDDVRPRIPLIPLPDVPPAGRLAATLGRRWGFDGRLISFWSDQTLSEYRLADLDDRTATFDRIGQYRPTLLQRLVNRDRGMAETAGNGLIYVPSYSGSDTFGAGVTVLDAGGPRPMRPVGHFAAPGAWNVHPLPDGRAVVFGRHSLWLVGPPKRAGG